MRLIAFSAIAIGAAALSACAENGGEPSSSMTAASGPPAAAGAASPVIATAYVAEAGRSDMYEIQSSKLALSSAASAPVKDFANMMLADHAKSTQMVMAAATQAGMAPPPTPPVLDARREALLDQLRSATGADFDRIYKHQQLLAHREALALHQGYAASGDSAPLRGAAAQIVPVVQQHLATLTSMGAT
jgi:putative membrane protein